MSSPTKINPAVLNRFFADAENLQTYEGLEGWHTPSEALQLGPKVEGGILYAKRKT